MSVPRFEAVRKEALDFLKDHSTAVIATTRRAVPYASTVYYIVDDDLNFYFVTQINTNKYANLSKNSRVAVVVGTGPEHISINAQGRGDFVYGEEKTAVFERMLMLLYREHVKRWPLREMQKFKESGVAVFKIVPEKIVFMNMDDENYSASISDRYTTIASSPRLKMKS